MGYGAGTALPFALKGIALSRAVGNLADGNFGTCHGVLVFDADRGAM